MKIKLKMNLKIIFFALIIFSIKMVKSQTVHDTLFNVFATRQDTLFVKTYEQKDIKAYNKLLDNFLSKYDNLDSSDKNFFNSYLINAYYNLCCTYSLLNKKDFALKYLEKSIKAGYVDYMHILGDSDLNNIRNEKKFKQLIAPLHETGDYLYILKKANKYDDSQFRKLPDFIYQSSNDLNLTPLHKAFNLDSIAGTGNDVSQILNLMHWIHDLIPHDGNHENPKIKNAMKKANC